MLEQVKDRRHRFLVGDQVGLVDLEVLDDRRDAPEPDAFGDRAAVAGFGLSGGEQVVHGGAARVGAADDDALVLLAQKACDAGERAAGADGADEAVDLAVGLLPDFRAGRDVMRLAVVEIVPLIGEQHTLVVAFAQIVGQATRDVLIIVRIAVRHRRHFDEFGAAQPQHVLLFLALRVGNDDQRAIAARVGDQRQPDAGVAGGAFDHDAAAVDLAARLRLQDHLARRAIFDRAARIHEFGFAEDGAAGRRRRPLQLDQRRVADGFDDTVAD